MRRVAGSRFSSITFGGRSHHMVHVLCVEAARHTYNINSNRGLSMEYHTHKNASLSPMIVFAPFNILSENCIDAGILSRPAALSSPQIELST